MISHPRSIVSVRAAARTAAGCALLIALLGGPAQAQNGPISAADTAEMSPEPDQTIRPILPTPSEPIVLRNRKSVRIERLKIDADVSIDLRDCEDVVIISCNVRSIRAGNVKRLRIYNSFIHDSENNAVNLDGCDDVVVQGNRMERIATGVYAHKSTAVQVVGNLCIDVQGPMPRGQLAQFDKVTGPNNLILGNIAVNHHGRSNPEDTINLYQSVGTADSPIRVENNILLGDPERGSHGFSDSGSGIMLGDGGGQHQLCTGNTLHSPGQVGIGVAGGGDITVASNLVYGETSNVANVGIYTWNQYKDQPTGDVLVADNRVAWVNAQGRNNSYWNGDGFTKVTQRNNRFDDPTIHPGLFPDGSPIYIPPLLHGRDVELPYILPAAAVD